MPNKPPAPPAEPPEYYEQPPSCVPRERKRLSRRASLIGTVLALVLAAGMAWLAWDLTRPPEHAAAAAGPGRGGAGAARGGRSATTVGFAVATSADIPVSLEALGTVVPQATVRVRPQVSGVLQQIAFKEGQNVRKGQLLATIDPRSFEMALQQALGQRMRDEAQLAAARVTLTRFQTLLKQDSIARQDVDTQAATVRQLEAAVVSDKAAEGTARLNLSYTRIVAPITGRVGLRNVDVGNTVSNSDANGLVTITQLTPIDVQFAIPQDHASWLQHNAGAFMEVKAWDRTRTTLLDTGVFASLDNSIDTTTGTVKAKARFNNTRQQLFPSQFVNVALQVRIIQDAVVVPVTAMRQGTNGEYVFVLQDDHTVKVRQVTRGQVLGDRVQVASGLQIGEKVITEGADRLRDGARVTLPGDAPRAGGGGAGGRRRGASEPFTGASAAQGSASSPFARAPASAAMGAGPTGAGPVGDFSKLTPEERAKRREAFMKLSPEERAARRQQRGGAAGSTSNP